MSGTAVVRDATATDDPPVRAVSQAPLLRNLPKHARYATAYRRFDYFWGLGLEHETYVASSQTRIVRAFDEAAMKPERYSVSYYKAYQPAALKEALAEVLAASPSQSEGSEPSSSAGRASCAGLRVPVLLNNHSFTDADVFGEHKTTYERVPQPNPRYEGKSLYEWASLYSAWLRDERDQIFTWDGDTVEFMTQRFYNARVADVIAELVAGEERFVAELATLPKRGLLCAYTPLRLAAPVNEPWATYLTHPRGISMFNNGTIHVNVTLPTRLGWNREPLWWGDFVEKHRRLARLIQWLEPLWVACYGSGDPFATRATKPETRALFAAGSQRLAVSRYIGVGTYDTAAMPRGKILQVPRPGSGEIPWYDWLYTRTAYAPLGVIGLDLNFNKHGAHGLELRFFDQMPMESLRLILCQLVVLMDVALSPSAKRAGIPDPRQHPAWQVAAGESLYYGPDWRVEPEFLVAIAAATGADALDQKEPMTPHAALTALMGALHHQKGWCWQRMIGNSESVAERPAPPVAPSSKDGRVPTVALVSPQGMSCCRR